MLDDKVRHFGSILACDGQTNKQAHNNQWYLPCYTYVLHMHCAVTANGYSFNFIKNGVICVTSLTWLTYRMLLLRSTNYFIMTGWPPDREVSSFQRNVTEMTKSQRKSLVSELIIATTLVSSRPLKAIFSRLFQKCCCLTNDHEYFCGLTWVMQHA